MDLRLGSILNQKYLDILKIKIETIHQEYIFLNIDEEKIKEIIEKIIKENVLYNDKLLCIEFIGKELKKELDFIVESKLQIPYENYYLIDNFINFYYSDINNYFDAVKALMKINDFFNKYSFFPEQSLILKIIQENMSFNKIMCLIIKYIKFSGDYINNFDENIFIYIRTYCLLYNIDLLNENDLLKENRYSGDSVKEYLNEIGKYKVLTREEEIEFIKRIKSGDHEAKELFIKHNLKLVIDVANSYNYRNKSLDFIDLIQEGNLGLIKAVSTFDINKGYKFSTYATYVIRDYIIKALKEKGRMIKIPSEDIKKITSYRKIKDDFLDKFGRTPTTKEISDIMNISEEIATRISMFEHDTISLNNLCEDNKHEYFDFISDKNNPVEEFIEEKEKREFIRNVLDNSGLNERELGIVKLYFGIDCRPISFLKIAEVYSISPARVAQIMDNILKKLRNLKLLNLYYSDEYELNNSEYKIDNILLFLNKSRISLTKDLNNQPYLVQMLIKSNFAKKEIDFFLLHYGCKLGLNEIADEYKNKFTSQSGKDTLRVLRNISVIVNNKIKKSIYYNEIIEYVKDYEKIIKEFNEEKKIKSKIKVSFI